MGVFFTLLVLVGPILLFFPSFDICCTGRLVSKQNKAPEAVFLLVQATRVFTLLLTYLAGKDWYSAADVGMTINPKQVGGHQNEDY